MPNALDHRKRYFVTFQIDCDEHDTHIRKGFSLPELTQSLAGDMMRRSLEKMEAMLGKGCDKIEMGRR